MIKKLLLSVALGVFFLLVAVLPKNAWAADLTVNCDDNGCLPATTSSIFPGDFWYPGRIVSRSIQINNTGANGLTISNRPQNTNSSGDLDQKIQLSILRTSDDYVIWAGSLHNFYKTGGVSLGSLGAGNNDSFIYTMTMDLGANNQYQNKNTSYNLVLTFTGGSSQVLGASTTASLSVCSDPKPGSAPKITAAVTGSNSVTLFWDKANDPISYYLITYGTTPGAQTYGNPNVGGKDTTSYTVSGLSGGSTYYFRVRAGNGCTPGDFSDEVPATPTGGFIAGPAAGFTSGVLGQQENLNSGAATQAAGIKGVKGQATAVCKNCLWWPILVVLALVLGIYYFLMRKRPFTKWRWILGFGAGVIAYIVFILLNNGSN